MPDSNQTATAGSNVPLPRAIVLGTCLGLVLGVVGAAGWALAIHYTPVQIGFIAWGIGWLAGKGMHLGNGGRTGLGWAALAVSITLACFALSKLFTILLRVSEGSEILDWWIVYQDEYYVLDLLWILCAVWPAYGIGSRGRDY